MKFDIVSNHDMLISKCNVLKKKKSYILALELLIPYTVLYTCVYTALF